jgi:hypothetical protein
LRTKNLNQFVPTTGSMVVPVDSGLFLVTGSIVNRLIEPDVSVPDFEVEPTPGVGTHPGLELDVRTQSPKIRKRY